MDAGTAAGRAGFYNAVQNPTGINRALAAAPCALDSLRPARRTEAISEFEAVFTFRAKSVFAVQFVSAVRAVVHHASFIRHL